MANQPVPVTMGSPRFTAHEVDRFLVTHAWFPPGATLEPHVHDRPTFAMILEGGFDLEFSSAGIRRKSFSSPPGTIFTEPAGEKHKNSVSDRGASVIVFQPEASATELDRACIGVLDRINHFRHEGIARIGRQLAREVLQPDSLAPLAIEALALEMLVGTARLDDSSRRSQLAPPWMSRAVDFVHENFRLGVRIADVAAAAGVHPAHLAATFRLDRGVPLGAYIRRLRLEWAAEELARTGDSISRIAVEAGFADQAHLTRMFKAETGMTPAKYRRSRQQARNQSRIRRSIRR